MCDTLGLQASTGKIRFLHRNVRWAKNRNLSETNQSINQPPTPSPTPSPSPCPSVPPQIPFAFFSDLIIQIQHCGVEVTFSCVCPQEVTMTMETCYGEVGSLFRCGKSSPENPNKLSLYGSPCALAGPVLSCEPPLYCCNSSET